MKLLGLWFALMLCGGPALIAAPVETDESRPVATGQLAKNSHSPRSAPAEKRAVERQQLVAMGIMTGVASFGFFAGNVGLIAVSPIAKRLGVFSASGVAATSSLLSSFSYGLWLGAMAMMAYACVEHQIDTKFFQVDAKQVEVNTNETSASK